MDLYSKLLFKKCKLKKRLFKFMKLNFKFEDDLMFRDGFHVKILGGKVTIKSGCFFNNYCSINSLGYVSIGENCIFGENVKIYDHNHKFGHGKITKNSGYTIGKVVIKNNVWVGSNVIILKDVTIGNNVVIGAGCVITSNIPDNSVVTTTREISIDELR